MCPDLTVPNESTTSRFVASFPVAGIKGKGKLAIDKLRAT